MSQYTKSVLRRLGPKAANVRSTISLWLGIPTTSQNPVGKERSNHCCSLSIINPFSLYPYQAATLNLASKAYLHTNEEEKIQAMSFTSWQSSQEKSTHVRKRSRDNKSTAENKRQLESKHTYPHALTHPLRP